MSLKLIFIVSIFNLYSALTADVNGQVKVLAHITAEVVESAHASSEIINDPELRNENINSSIYRQNKSFDNEILNVGAVRINSGEDVACCIDLHKTILKDHSGNSFTIEPASINSELTYSPNGSHTLLLNGIASVSDYSAKGFYTGHLTVVVQYN